MNARRVLIVDDEAAQRRVLCRLFEAHGFTASAVTSGVEVLDATAGSSPPPHLILADISMPDMDGVALLKALRARPATSAIPVILMTGLLIPDVLLEAAAETLGAGPIHVKGGDAGSLLSRVRRALQAPTPHPNGVLIDPLKRTIWIGGRRLPELPARRFQLLCALLHRSRAMYREELLGKVWEGSDNLNIVDVTILRLRRDLQAFPFLRIETTPAGYRLTIDARPGSSARPR